MATFTRTGYQSPGLIFTVDGVSAPPALTDFLVMNGYKQAIQEWIRCGVIRPVSTTGNVTTYHQLANTFILGENAGP